MIRHETDEPYSFEEFSYGRLPTVTTAMTTEKTTTTSTTTEDGYNLFAGNDRWMETPQHRFDLTTQRSGYMRFNTMKPEKDANDINYWDSDWEDYPNADSVSIH